MAKADEVAFQNFDLKAEHPAAKDDEVRFVFEFPELLAEFEAQDARANIARDFNKRIGWIAIGLVWLGLVIGSFELVPKNVGLPGGALDESYAIAALVLSLAGTLLGLSGLHHKSPRWTWLQCRLRTEMLRLFHFHFIAANLHEILAVKGDAARQDAYRKRRFEAFETLRTTTLANPEAELDHIVARENETDFASLAPLVDVADADSTPVVDKIFTVWRALRLDWQLGYADAKLRKPARRRNPRWWARTFTSMGWVCLVLILLLHIVHLANVNKCIPEHLPALLVVLVAMTALAARALEEGMQPHREVERYEGYRASIRAAKDRFEVVHGLPAKLGVARSFERTSMEEMRVFLRTHAEAKFLL